MKKYAVFNPLDGQYYFVDTIQECQEKMANISYDFYMFHTHNSPVSLVEYFEDGSENWKSADGTIIQITKEMKELFANNQLIPT